MKNNLAYHILGLPLFMLRELLTVWLKDADIGRLDSAMCSKSIRSLFLDILKNDRIVMQHITKKSNEDKFDSWMKWLYHRKVTTNTCYISPSVKPKIYLPYLAASGSEHKILNLHCKRSMKKVKVACLMATIACYCTNLREVDIFNCSSLFSLQSILRTSHKTITSLQLYRCNITSLRAGNIHLEAMQKLCIEDCSGSTGSRVSQLCRSSPNLAVLFIDSNRAFKTGDLMRCIHLRVVWLEGIYSLLDSEFQSLVHNCPLLEAAGIAHCTELTNVSVVELVKHATHLSVLSLCRNSYFTDTALDAMALHCGDRLTHLDISACHNVTIQGFMNISEKCTNLIGFQVRDMSHIPVIGIQTVLRSNPLLQEVSLGCGDMNAQLAVLPDYCCDIHYLDISDTCTFDVLVIADLARKCRKLRTVVVSSNCSLFSPLACILWQKYCTPGMVFLRGPRPMPYWAQYWPSGALPARTVEDESSDEDTGSSEEEEASSEEDEDSAGDDESEAAAVEESSED